jgi:hypothetical protein
MRICDSDRRTEHIIIRRRREAERIEPLTICGELASSVKRSQHFTRNAAAPGFVDIKMNRRPAAADGRNGKRGEKQRRKNRSLRHSPSSPLPSILDEASPPSKRELGADFAPDFHRAVILRPTYGLIVFD